MNSILVVEDNAADVVLLRRVFGSVWKSPYQLYVVSNDIEARAFLDQTGEYSNAPRPSIILLDLNLGPRDGRELLCAIKADQKFRSIPVVVMTTSATARDVSQAYGSYANSFIVKPSDLEVLEQIIETIEQYWFTIVRLPTHT